MYDSKELINPELLGEMVRQYRKAGFDIPEGQPRTSQDGEAIAKELNDLRLEVTKLREQLATPEAVTFPEMPKRSHQGCIKQ